MIEEANISNSSESEKVIVADNNQNWLNTKWRPAMAWMYMSVCIFDFMIAPIFWSLVQVFGKGVVQNQWNPLTLQGAGFFHLSMGAILGITAYGRTQEKMQEMTVK